MCRHFHPTLLPLFDGVPRHILGVSSAGAHAYTTAMIGRWAGGALALWGMAVAVMPGAFLQIYQYNAKGGGGYPHRTPRRHVFAANKTFGKFPPVLELPQQPTTRFHESQHGQSQLLHRVFFLCTFKTYLSRILW